MVVHKVPGISIVLLMMIPGLVHMGNTGGTDSPSTVDDFRPGDTLRYTTDGSTPDRTSHFVLFGANEVFVEKTTTFKARLYRPGFLPSEVQSQTVYVRDSAEAARAGLTRPQNAGGSDDWVQE